MLTPMRAAHCAGLMALAAIIAGCSALGLSSDKIDYKSVGATKPLDVPPDLSQLPRDDRYALPDRPGVASASAGAGAGAAPRAQTAAATQTVAPTSPRARIERAGSERWLAVDVTPEQAFEVVREFWISIGLGIERDDPQLGIIETVWAENRAKLPQDFIRRTIGRVLDGLYSTGEQDKYRARIERTARNTAEIYITHRGVTEVYTTAEKDSTRWQARPVDPELEAEMLQRLLLRFGPTPTLVGASEASVKPTVIPAEREISRIVPGNDGRSRSLEIDEPFDRAWRRVGLALDRGDFTVEDRDRAGGVYFVRYLDPEFEAKQRKGQGFLSRIFGGEAKINAQQLRVAVAAAGDKTTVNVLDKDSRPDTTAAGQRILETLQRLLGVAGSPTAVPTTVVAPVAPAPLQVAAAPDVARMVRGSDGRVQRIELDEPVDRAWRRVGLALDRGGFKVDDLDRIKGVYFVRYLDREAEDKQRQNRGFLSRMFGGEAKVEAQQFRVAVTAAGDGSDVTVLDKDGKPDSTALGQRIFGNLQRLLPQFTFATAAPVSSAPAQAAAGRPAPPVAPEVARIVRDGEGRQRLEIDEPIDRAWGDVALALGRSGFTIEDRDRVAGTYVIRYLDPEYEARQRESQGVVFRLIFGAGKVEPQQFRVVANAAGDRTNVAVLDKDGKPDATPAGRKILERTLLHFRASASAPAPARAANGTAAAAAIAPEFARIVRDGDGRAQRIEIDQPFDRAWGSVGFALDRSGLTVEERDRAKAAYVVRYLDPELAAKKREGEGAVFRFIFGSTKMEPQQFRVVVGGAGEKSSSVAVLDKDGQPDTTATSQKILERMVLHLAAAAPAAQPRAAAGATAVAPGGWRIARGGDGTAQRIEIGEPFDRAWRRVGLALDRGGFTVEDRDRASGVFFVRYLDPEFESRQRASQGFFSRLFGRDQKIEAQQFRVLVADAGGATAVTVLDKDGKPEGGATGQKILRQINEQLK